MGKRNRFRLGLVGVLASALLLSGCVTMRSEITIKSDGSGTQTVILAMSKEMTDLAAQGNQTGDQSAPAQSKDPLADAQSQFKTLSDKVPGATFEPYKDATGKSGFKVVLPFQNLEELSKLQLSDKPSDSMDQITFTKSGNLVTLKMNVNTGDMAAKASGDEAAATKTPQEEAMQAQMMAAMGMDISYAIAPPGKILDWSPKEKVTYDAAKNKLIWVGDLNNKPLMLTVKWDNSRKPEKINVPPAATTTELASQEAPTAEATTTDTGTSLSTASTATLDTVTQYADAMMSQDQAALEALLAGAQTSEHPLRQNLPDMFKAGDLSVVYLSTVADAKMGVAEWQAQWTNADGNSQTLSGMDVLTFDSAGKIATLKTYVDPTEFTALQGTGQ
jgi:hypothetical protein